jgi:hypothetical protein
VFKVKTVDDLWDHIAYVMTYASVGFPYRDFLPADQQMNLERGFDLLRQGILVAYPEESFAKKRAELDAILDESFALYRAGEDVKAGHLLNEFQDAIFKQ